MSEEELKKELSRIDKKVKSELAPFLDGIRSGKADYDLFEKAYEHWKKRDIHGHRVFDFLLEDFKENPRGEMNALFAYLGLVEGLGNCCVDIIVMLLIANGRAFHIECRHTTPRIKHAVSMEELERERVPLTTKLNFLRENGITELSSIIDSELRNRVAHLRFTVRGDVALIRGKRAWDFLMDEMLKLHRALWTADKTLRQLAKKKDMIPKKKEKL